MAALLLLVLALPDAPEREKLDEVQMIRGPSAWDLDWSDAEDRMHGSLRPLDPVSGQPLELSVTVGTFQGENFDGPVGFTMRCSEWSETKTVTRAKGERAWAVTFVPTSKGEDCTLDWAFTSTRHKRLHSKIYVTDAPLDRWPWFVILGLAAALALGLGIRAVLKKPEQA
jgi:hypothetical protein